MTPSSKKPNDKAPKVEGEAHEGRFERLFAKDVYKRKRADPPAVPRARAGGAAGGEKAGVKPLR